jgi:hypothetical protein
MWRKSHQGLMQGASTLDLDKFIGKSIFPDAVAGTRTPPCPHIIGVSPRTF